jgi:hypothetical protein
MSDSMSSTSAGRCGAVDEVNPAVIAGATQQVRVRAMQYEAEGICRIREDYLFRRDKRIGSA